jgi:predicted nucleic acid-binding protein
MSAGITFDAGALIGLERRRQRILQIVKLAAADGVAVTVPAVVIAEWWRGRSDLRESILGGVRIEETSEELAKVAGEALAAVPGATSIDAIVMASAARRGDAVYTSDVHDLERLTSYFPSVRVFSV